MQKNKLLINKDYWILDTGCQSRPMPESHARIPEILINKGNYNNNRKKIKEKK